MTPDFDAFCQHLTANQSFPTHPAEIHGLGCGILAAGFRPNTSSLSHEISTYIDEPYTVSDTIAAYFQESLQMLEADDFEFQLCLPDDDSYGLAERLESLGAWCIGFLHGFAAVQAPLSEDAEELLKDLTEISQVDASMFANDDENNIDDNEVDYAELTEFVRMAVISLFMDNNRRQSDESENDEYVRH